MKPDNCPRLSESEFLQRYIQDMSQIMWFLGAGASRSARLPTASDIIWDLKKRHYCLHENQDSSLYERNDHNSAIRRKIQDYMDSKGYPKIGDPSEYSFYFNLVFGDDASAQQRYVQETLKSDSPNIGHRVLAALMGMRKVKVVFTTNFDDIIELAFAQVVGENLHTYHLEGSYAALESLNAENFPIYAKVHGDFRYHSIKNLEKDLLDNDEKIQECFLAASSRYGLVVSGYSGRDDSIMSMLGKAISQHNAFPRGLFWTTPKGVDVADHVSEFTKSARDKGIASHIVEIATFDDMLSKIWKQTPEKPQELNNKVVTSHVNKVNIELPKPGNQYPILRTNALPISTLPSCCGVVELKTPKTYGEIRDILNRERSPKAVWTYTDKILFWGNSKDITEKLPADQVKNIGTLDIEDGVEKVSGSTFIKSFFEHAVAEGLCESKPLSVRLNRRTYHAVVQHGHEGDRLFSGLIQELKRITGEVPRLEGVTWAESVSIKIEERAGRVWVMIAPDTWVKPLHRRKEALRFLRQHRLSRFNNKSYRILDLWIKILLGKVGGNNTVKVTCCQNMEHSAEFEIGTRTAYSLRTGQ